MGLTRTAAEKQRILESEGYRYNFDRELYFNRQAKKAFSIEFIEDHPPDELEQRIRENTPGKDWTFFFNSPPSDAVRRELISVLG